MPVLSCGAMRYQQSWNAQEPVSAESQANVERILQAAVDHGIVHIETARGYGTSERQTGVALRKFARAEPVAALYEQGRVCHVRNGAGLDLLEDQMCAFTLDRRANGSRSSPDRVDALVWALTDLMLRPGQDPRVRRLG